MFVYMYIFYVYINDTYIHAHNLYTYRHIAGTLHCIAIFHDLTLKNEQKIAIMFVVTKKNKGCFRGSPKQRHNKVLKI